MTAEMKIEDAKAIFLLEHCAERCGSYHKDDVCGNCEINAAIKALEKQIPKKPIRDSHSVLRYRCPTCKGTLSMYHTSFCKCCGQAIDWIGYWEDEE